MTHTVSNVRTVQHLLNEFFDVGKPMQAKQNQWNVKTNIHETADAYHLELLVPGVPKNDVKVAVDKLVLTVSFDAKEKEATPNYKTTYREFTIGSFKKSFHLTEKINVDGIKAVQENGILKLYLPKWAEIVQNAKLIDIE